MRISHLVLDGFSLSKKSRLQSGLFHIINETVIHISFRINIYTQTSHIAKCEPFRKHTEQRIIIKARTFCTSFDNKKGASLSSMV